ncbi:nodulation-signaling pathway 2 protein-like [Phalaenopsis equestris]|uniref:nodulation-signaling pathway 2 protein-like n=1 Tax=Phalaenopsis equestris TaxID=78828 RepID=UPI0009E616E4|nr:nodulation-signaling pathway 2 protein-like [Phalaenopsis equestris]
MDTGRRLAAFAASVGLSFSFGQCRMDADDQLRPAAGKGVEGPPHLPWRSAASVASFLRSAGELGARVVTVVEEAVACCGGDVNGGFVGSFMEEMKRYSAIWDSLEAGFPMQGAARGVVEKLILGPMIAGSVSRAYRRREEGGEEREGWAEWMEEVGFGTVGLSFFNLCQSRLLLGLFNDGYRVQEEGSNKLVFCWKNCRLLSASVWSAPALESMAVSSFSW